MKITNNHAFEAEKKTYVIPSTTTNEFRPVSICAASGGRSINSNTSLEYGGESNTIIPM